MKVYRIKARNSNVSFASHIISPDDGWTVVLDLPLQYIPRQDFIVKKPRRSEEEPCPHCGEDLILYSKKDGSIHVGCWECGQDMDWVYAQYRIVWKGE